MARPAPKTCPRTDSGCEYNCITTCMGRQVRVEPEPEADVAYVAMRKEAVAELLTAPMGPFVMLGLEPRGPGYELILRNPTAFELAAALDKVGKVDANLKAGL